MEALSSPPSVRKAEAARLLISSHNEFEKRIAIIGSAADGFRQEVIAYLWAANRRGEKIDYRSYEPLMESTLPKIRRSRSKTG